MSGGRLMSDFDMMLERKRADQKKRRKKKDIELINDNDDAIARLIADMRFAAREDNDLNQAGQPAIRKITMLRNVLSQLKKVDLQMAFVEANVLSVMTDWLAPLPDKSLPSAEIRRELLKILFTLRIDDQSRLKESGIGKAVMYLYKHPKEAGDNRTLAGKIINTWARPIFNKSTDYKTFEKDHRAERDKEILNKKRGREEDPEPEEDGLRVGDPGWIARARVPMPSSSDYIRRPKWQTDVEVVAKKRKTAGFIDKHMKAQMERKKNAKPRRAVEMSLEGRKMAL
jgi:transcription factor SPN1